MFIISPRVGLCNQLQTIVKGILLAIRYNRNLYIHDFQIDLQSGKLANCNEIFDIDKMNEFLQNKLQTPIQLLHTIDTNILDNLHTYHLPNIDYNKIFFNPYINDDIEANQHMEIIYLGSIISLDIHKSFQYSPGDYSDNNLYYVIMNNITFHPMLYRLKESMKQQLHITNFHCIHLRIEDDALGHFSKYYKLSIDEYNTMLKKFYEDAITRIGQDQTNIYICSGMLEFHNTINLQYYEDLMNSNTLLVDKKHIVVDEYYLHNRELIAILDLLLAFDSDRFVGSAISSFSQVIHTHHIYAKKESVLFVR
jgi:hypothetical protein